MRDKVYTFEETFTHRLKYGDQFEWPWCRYCKRHQGHHAEDGKCLFEPTHYAPTIKEWDWHNGVSGT